MNSIIQDIINTAWFSHAKAEGIVFKDFFWPDNKLPLTSIAFVLTAVCILFLAFDWLCLTLLKMEYALYRWETGTKPKKPCSDFSSKWGKPIFEKHMSNLQKVGEKSMATGGVDVVALLRAHYIKEAL
jgi:hypothetical protein